MKRLFFSVSIALCMAAGCQTTSSLQTFTQVYSAAVTADDLAVQAGIAALNGGLITSTQAQQVQDITVKAKTLLDAAQTAFVAGNAVSANQNVTAATTTLVALSLCLTQKPLTINTFATCAATVPALGVTS